MSTKAQSNPDKLKKLIESDAPIRPTGTCFDDAIDYIEWQIKQDFNPKWRERLVLGHGICLKDDDNNTAYAHAWVELDGKFVIQDGYMGDEKITFKLDKPQFYEKYQVQDFTLYSIKEMALKNFQFHHYGPWEDKYHALTKNSNNRNVSDLQVKCCESPKLTSELVKGIPLVTCKCGFVHEVPKGTL